MNVSHAKLLLLSAGALIATTCVQGCSIFDNIIEEHEKICIQNKQVIVHDEKLWEEYKILAERSFQESDVEYRAWINSDQGPKVSDMPEHTIRMYLESVDGFEERFGSSIGQIRPVGVPRPYTDGKIIRDDRFLMKDNKVVIQVVDYIGAWQTIDNLNGLDCLGHYGIIYTDKGVK
jgi:hypothetical protein